MMRRWKIAVLAGSVLYLCWNYYNRSTTFQWWMLDFNIYYNFSHYGERFGWFYKDWIAALWLVIESPVVWYILMSSCTLFLTWKLLEMKYGWILVIPFLKVSSWTLAGGNILPLIAALCLTPIGCLVAGLVKPQLLGFMVLHAVVRYRREIHERNAPTVVQTTGPTIPICRLTRLGEWWQDCGMKYALDEVTRRKA
jgi:hypothetical protein